MAAAAQQAVPAQVVGTAFVQQYYHIMDTNPAMVHRFYQDISKLGRPEEDGSMSITTTLKAIDEKIVSLNWQDFKSQIKSVDAQESLGGGVHVLVTGYLTGKDNVARNFAQTFFLAPQEKGYFVLNDTLQYLGTNRDLVNNILVPAESEPVSAASVLENHVSEESSPSAEEAMAGEVYDPPENIDIMVVEEVPVSEVVDEVQDVIPIVVETKAKVVPIVVEKKAKVVDMPKKSYASIVRDLKESVASFSPPPAAPQKALVTHVEPANPTSDQSVKKVSSGWDSADKENYQESEAEGYSVYVRGLPGDVTESMLREVFEEFGTIKNGGIQIINRRYQYGNSFGFVEFVKESSLEKAVEASPVMIYGCRVHVEEKMSSLRGDNSRRSQPVRGGGFRGGRGNYGGYNDGGREYGNSRGGFNGGSSFSNRGGYQRSDGDRTNNKGGRGSMAPRFR